MLSMLTISLPSTMSFANALSLANTDKLKGLHARPLEQSPPVEDMLSTSLGAMPTTGSGPVKRCTGNRLKAAASAPVSGSRFTLYVA
jgi:hypothetical protein